LFQIILDQITCIVAFKSINVYYTTLYELWSQQIVFIHSQVTPFKGVNPQSQQQFSFKTAVPSAQGAAYPFVGQLAVLTLVPPPDTTLFGTQLLLFVMVPPRLSLVLVIVPPQLLLLFTAPPPRLLLLLVTPPNPRLLLLLVTPPNPRLLLLFVIPPPGKLLLTMP